MKKYIVKLSGKERIQLQNITRKGKHGARVIKRARILLKSDTGHNDSHIAKEVEVSTRTVQRVRERYDEYGLERALYDAPRPGQPAILDDKSEARLIAIACSDPPKGYIRWTLELLRERLVQDNVVNHISTVAIWNHLAHRGIKPWREKNVGYS